MDTTTNRAQRRKRLLEAISGIYRTLPQGKRAEIYADAKARLSERAVRQEQRYRDLSQGH